MKITEACIQKPVFAWMLMAATVVFGGVAASRIGVSQFLGLSLAIGIVVDDAIMVMAGAAFALSYTGYSLNIFSMIGLLLLMGIVKKNSIILVDYATKLRAEGRGAREAMLEAGPVRLRPILMTSIATLMAAIPASLALGSGAEVRAPMAVAVIGGLAVSTVLSLVVVPAFYVLADGAMAWLRRRVGRPAATSSGR